MIFWICRYWFFFIVTYKGEIKGCGVNQFTLARKADDWRIIFGADIAAGEDADCESFKKHPSVN